MNILPAAAAFLICLVIGIAKSTELKKRSLLLAELKQLTTEFSISIRCTAPTLDELCESCTGVFGELLREKKAESSDIRTVWSSAAEQLAACPFCHKDEARLLLEMGQALGTCNAEGQLSLLEMYGAKLESISKSAEKDLLTKGKMCRSVSALLGAGIAVLII